ncbi:hypothetical protein VP01_2138g1 [Puccinia sorghi]|uniref:Uncharacterized protein n=1 Tax=Puccinia sorghi TaxID=27349 RepID=A0A0L6V9T5_9BASI|nr:hypothetical protein VP01_2138g1 [Puccinia sorghi]
MRSISGGVTCDIFMEEKFHHPRCRATRSCVTPRHMHRLHNSIALMLSLLHLEHVSLRDRKPVQKTSILNKHFISHIFLCKEFFVGLRARCPQFHAVGQQSGSLVVKAAQCGQRFELSPCHILCTLFTLDIKLNISLLSHFTTQCHHHVTNSIFNPNTQSQLPNPLTSLIPSLSPSHPFFLSSYLYATLHQPVSCLCLWPYLLSSSNFTPCPNQFFLYFPSPLTGWFLKHSFCLPFYFTSLLSSCFLCFLPINKPHRFPLKEPCVTTSKTQSSLKYSHLTRTLSSTYSCAQLHPLRAEEGFGIAGVGVLLLEQEQGNAICRGKNLVAPHIALHNLGITHIYVILIPLPFGYPSRLIKHPKFIFQNQGCPFTPLSMPIWCVAVPNQKRLGNSRTALQVFRRATFYLNISLKIYSCFCNYPRTFCYLQNTYTLQSLTEKHITDKFSNFLKKFSTQKQQGIKGFILYSCSSQVCGPPERIISKLFRKSDSNFDPSNPPLRFLKFTVVFCKIVGGLQVVTEHIHFFFFFFTYTVYLSKTWIFLYPVSYQIYLHVHSPQLYNLKMNWAPFDLVRLSFHIAFTLGSFSIFWVLFGFTAENLDHKVSIPLESKKKHFLSLPFALCNPERDPQCSALSNSEA